MPTAKFGYKLKNGQKVPGVTTILSRFKESGGLLHWAFDQGKACERGEISALYDKRDEAATAGTLAHSMVEAYINGLESPDLSSYPDSVVSAAMQGYENYRRWESDNRINVVKQEMQMVSEKYGFGGCPDAIGVDSRDAVCLLDWKTSSTGPYVDWLLQLAAYQLLHEENHPEQLITGGFHLLRFSKENADFHHHHWGELNEATSMFVALLTAYIIDKRLKKRL